jgi:hypothetical protein
VREHSAKTECRGSSGFYNKSAIQLHRRFLGKKQNFTGFLFWIRGYCVSTVGRDEKMIREYIKNQEKEELRAEAAQLNMFEGPSGPNGGNK